jgi:hypothetical protein
MIRGKTARIILGICFVALLAMPLILRWRAKSRETTAADPSSALARYGFYLQEVSRASNVNFTHHPPTLDHRLDHIMPQVASMGAAVSVVDFNRDGWADLYVTNSGEGSKNSLFKNNTDGSFSDVATEMGVADLNQVGTGVSMVLFGATTITTVTKICFSTSGASPNSFTTTADRSFLE